MAKALESGDGGVGETQHRRVKRKLRTLFPDSETELRGGGGDGAPWDGECGLVEEPGVRGDDVLHEVLRVGDGATEGAGGGGDAEGCWAAWGFLARVGDAAC